MKQCLLTSGTLDLVAWIPDEFAVVGKIIDVRQKDGKWSEGWTVDIVYGPLLSFEYVREHERDYKSQRKASDI